MFTKKKKMNNCYTLGIIIIINGRPAELGDDEEMERRRPRRCSVQTAVAVAAAVAAVRSLKESSIPT